MSRTLIFTLAITLTAFTGQAQWESLMPEGDVEALSGEWTMDGDTLVGKTTGDEYAWWVAEGEYWDFELSVEFKTPTLCNGGVEMRSHWLPVTPIDADTPPNELERGMHGYQANIDTRSPEGTGGIMESNGRGSLIAPSKDAQETIKTNEWNTLWIRATGNTIEVKLNDVTACRLYDEAHIGGVIALQVAPYEANGTPEVHYRNLKINDLGRAANWRSLFDGETLNGWKEWGSEEWRVEDGVILGRRGPKESEGYLATEETWKDFHVRGEFKMMGDGNYGLFYHSSIRLRDDGYPLISGVQGEVEPSFPGSTGWFYESYRRGWIVDPKKDVPAAYLLRPGEWNSIEIRAEGNRVMSWVNGMRVIDLVDDNPQVFEGSFALQLHTGEGAGINWRELHVKE